MDIFKNHPKGSAGARAILLAKSIQPCENPSLVLPAHEPMYTAIKFEWIARHYADTNDKKRIKQESIKLKDRMSEAYRMESAGEDMLWQHECFFHIALTLRYAIDGNDSAAWSAFADASWLAGYGAQLRKTALHIENYTALAIKRKAEIAARDGYDKSIKHQIKDAIKGHWSDWQYLMDWDPASAKALYKNKTSFAYDMLIKYPQLKGASKNDTTVIMGWIRGWETPTKADETQRMLIHGDELIELKTLIKQLNKDAK